MSTTQKRWPAETDEAHPEIFTVMPAQPKKKKPGQLPEKDIRQFFELGYVVVEDFFDKKDLEACRKAIEEKVEQLAQKLLKGGKIRNTYSEYGFFERLTMLEKDFPGATILLHKLYALPKAFSDLWSSERLLNVVEQLIGPDIMGHPVWNLRAKTPQNESATVPWHQDIAYLDNDSYTVLQPAAWIPLLDANEANGCLQMAERGHRTGKIARHTCCAGNTWYTNLAEEEMVKTLGVDLEKDLKILPVKYGGMVLFNNIIPHRSLENFSDKIRWSLDLRWQTPFHPAGFHGIKEGVVFRSPQNPNLKIEWGSFDQVDIRSSIRNKEEVKKDEFDTIVTGPWMVRWEITHHNRHTDAVNKEKMEYTKA
ncbi:phytanoyl-CoA dioxygenase domain-containing protein 1-like [Liolophura sinensis]|uniref:phytanoyl-CoA dioxygenase domain-containing protein 1-like n=1 Tax=Liolophura sinensis TaxID=3198878 RepID=UPI0031580059